MADYLAGHQRGRLGTVDDQPGDVRARGGRAARAVRAVRRALPSLTTRTCSINADRCQFETHVTGDLSDPRPAGGPQAPAFQPRPRDGPGPARGVARRGAARRRDRPEGHAAQRHRRQRDELGDLGLRRHLDARTASSARGSTSPASPPPRGLPGLHGLRAAGPVRRDADRRRADRRPGAERRPASSRPARCSARRSSSWTGSTGVVPPDVLPYNCGRQLAGRRVRGGPAPAAGQHGRGDRRAARDPRRGADFAFLDRGDYAGRDAAGAQPGLGAARGTSGRSPTSAARRSPSARSTGSRPTCPTPAAPTRCCAGATRGSAT